MEEYFQQEDAKNMQGNTILRENTLPQNFSPLVYQRVINFYIFFSLQEIFVL